MTWTWINEDLIWEPWLTLLILEGLGLLIVLNCHLFPIAPLFLWDLTIYSIFFFPTLSLAPLQPLKTFWSSCACVCKLLSILEFCQVYVVFVFMGASRVNNSLDTWEIECISCEALSLFILKLINYFAMIGLLRWFSRVSWLFGSLHVRCYPFLSFLDVHWEICKCLCLSFFDILGFCSLFHFAQERKRLSMGGFWCAVIFSYFLTLFAPF